MKLADLSILEVWRALGGGELRGGRGKAFWRNGDGYSISMNLTRHTWFDFRDQRGGGVLALVEVALGCGRAEALAWLEVNCGLDSTKKASPRERERCARVRAEAPVLAQRLEDFNRGLELTSTSRGAVLLRNATATDIAARWQELELERRLEIETLGREDRLDCERVTQWIVRALAADQEARRAA